MEQSKDKMRETLPYLCWKRYRDTFFRNSNLEEVLKECRDFVAGKHYDTDTINDLPKPVFNICREETEKTTAKLREIQPKVSFVADIDSECLQDLDNFYEYQMKEIDDDDITDRVCRAGWIDGTALSITSFDTDTLGIPSLFKGFLKRQIIPIENTYWENPHCEDEQDQQYWGYFFPMAIKAVKRLVEGKTKKEIDDLILPESFYENSLYRSMSKSEIDNEMVNVYVRFFRIDNEVFFEMSTRWCDVYEYPHALNPNLNSKIIRLKKKEFFKKLKENEDDEKDIIDYDFDDPKYTLFTKAIRFNEKDYQKEKSKFYRYPVSMYRPYPIAGSILGESGVALIIANQKIINYTFLLILLIMQSHAMPKILTKPDALGSQTYDNSPNQILVDYTPITSGTQWGITRLSSGDTVNSNLIEIGSTIINLTRNINGFDDLISNISNDTSGYAYQQVVKQANLTLAQPQKKLWKYIKNNARTDILYFKFYIPEAKYYVRRSDSEVELNERYREMSQELISQGKIEEIPSDYVLPKTNKIQIKTVNSKMFDSDFNVSIEVEQGIASSEISESQHYQQVFQYIASGNLDADKIKLLIQNDPAFSAKTRQRIMASLEALENSQLQIKNQEIAELKGLVENLIANLKVSNNNLNYLKLRDQAKDKALMENINKNKAFFQTYADSQKNTMTESEVKALNAKGIKGGSFSKGGSESVVNTSE